MGNYQVISPFGAVVTAFNTYAECNYRDLPVGFRIRSTKKRIKSFKLVAKEGRQDLPPRGIIGKVLPDVTTLQRAIAFDLAREETARSGGGYMKTWWEITEEDGTVIRQIRIDITGNHYLNWDAVDRLLRTTLAGFELLPKEYFEPKKVREEGFDSE